MNPNEIFKKFTPNAKNSLLEAQKEAEKRFSSYIGTQHLLLGLFSQKRSVGAEILVNFGLSQEKIELVLAVLEPFLGEIESGSELSDFSKKAIENAAFIAKKYGHFFVGTEHLLWGILSQKNSNAYRIIQELNIDPEEILRELEKIFEATAKEMEEMFKGGGPSFAPSEMMKAALPSGPVKRNKTPSLDYFTIDLNRMAAEGKLDPIIGREKEIERVIQILSRRTKNNPVLIGEPGVGKTAIVEGLAQKIVENKVPSTLADKRILALDLAALIAGTKYRGEFEERIKKVLEEAKKNEDVILFIDEFHTVVGAGAAEGALDAANILKPALSRGEVRCIGATTLNEYRKYIEKDAALERRFQPVLVDELSVEDAIKVLEGIKHKYEEFHNVEITKEAIEAAVKLAKRYIQDRYLPDKAIDLIDEAASKVRLKEEVTSPEVEELKKKMEEMKLAKEKAVEDQDYERAAMFRDKEEQIKQLIGKIKQEKLKEKGRLKITDEDIAEVVSQWTGIPVTKMIGEETEKLANLEEILKKRIVGQDEAISAIAKAIRRGRLGISSPKRPIGSFIFLGPTGVGKTELAKVLAEAVFGSEDALIKIDMSEFMERHNVSRLVGAPPGYVGYEEEGKLTNAVRTKPYSVVLLDEIEKAHPDVFNMLLQILEDGVLTDAKGKKVDFKNTIIIMTSNIGVDEFNRQASIGFRVLPPDEKKAAEEKYEEIKQNILTKLKNFFRPELINRIDKIIVFRPLNREAIEKIVDIQLNDFAERLKEKNIEVNFSQKVKEMIAEKGFDPEFGARPLRRTIQDEIEDPLSGEIIQGKVKEGDKVLLDIEDDKVVVRKN